ncbi:hypothetical protein SASPL_138068 [Salvia splendens]|uniref:VQ domain-containing protein n=1 Tax=Salvia splendens TaxID=180675 RepID=A0A8X8ZEM7_SALSN|nr:uncharacterized protein LOC121764291 [Salvia splendens]KAG6401219.1 hypothetical protein SASPL_138068 [Salvia splendens]
MHSFSSSNSSTQSGKRPPSFRSALHTVRKPTKKPIAPLPPAPPRIYKVAPVEFKDVVQKLTGGGVELQPTRLLREVAPPPLSLHPQHRSENEEEKRQKSVDACFGILSPLGFSISPSSLAWCSAVLLSPGTLASFDPNLLL